MKRSRIGGLISAFWLVVWCFFISNNWSEVNTLSANEWGDFFAGIFAPLAFLWLVIGYLQTSEELRQNTKVLQLQEKTLQLQVQELKASVEQQKLMVTETRRQFEHMQGEQWRNSLRERVKTQPIFVQQQLWSGSDDPDPLFLGAAVLHGKHDHWLDIQNVGYIVTEVSISAFYLDESKTALRVTRSFFDSWPTETSYSIGFYTKPDADVKKGTSIILRFVFKDGRGLTSTYELESEISEDYKVSDFTKKRHSKDEPDIEQVGMYG